LIPYQTFLQSHTGLSREQFFGKIQVPHVLITTTVAGRESGFQTVKFTKEAVTESRGSSKGTMILPVRKRPEANAFGMMITIGRAANNDLVIEHQKISKFHAYFRQTGDEWRICDANSRNGTEVSEVEVTPGQDGLPVFSGSRVRLGKAVTLVFLAPAELYTRCLADAR
jgi:pSer/pThr/pTyr-binding forkhead associated (FHA) protein